jgi:hypothetical protein
MAIQKSVGQTRTEQYLSQLCERTFLNLWSYTNPYKADGKELCDVIAIFGNNVFLFFDRESRKFDHGGDVLLTWERWKKEAITKQIRTAAGAKRYVLNNRDEIYLDANRKMPLPLRIPAGELRIHKILVAHGAKEACEQFSSSNVYGSIGVSYEAEPSGHSHAFIVSLDRSDPVHLLDSPNLELILGELDTVYDFQRYLTVKETSISRYDRLTYCGEEDLIAHYFLNFDPESKSYMIGPKEEQYNFLMIGEGEWRDFVSTDAYQRRKADNRISYVWDRLIQKTGQNALRGTLGGNSDVFRGKSAIHEMAKEHRLSRRALSEIIVESIKSFPDGAKGIVRKLSFMPSYYPGTAYVFLQIFHENPGDYETEYRPIRRSLLEIACGAAKLKFSYLNKVVGIAIDAPKYSQMNSEDFIVLNCENWSEEDKDHYRKANKELRFFTTALKEYRKHITEFPSAQSPNDPSD